jgi:hypothetical protein
MKQAKDIFLFLLLFSFLSCKKEIETTQNDVTISDELSAFYKSETYKKSNYEKKLKLSFKLLKDKDLNSFDTYAVYNVVNFLYNKQLKTDSAIWYAKKMLSLPIVKSDKNLRGQVFFKLGSYFYKTNVIDSAYFYYANSKEQFLDIKDSLNLGKVLTNLSIVESDLGSYDSSDSLAVQSEKFKLYGIHI